MQGWTPLDFQVVEDVSFLCEIADQTLATRGVTVPELAAKWDCDISGGYLVLQPESIDPDKTCAEETLTPADMSNCTGPAAELAEVILEYLCDEADSLTSATGVDCSSLGVD